MVLVMNDFYATEYGWLSGRSHVRKGDEGSEGNSGE